MKRKDPGFTERLSLKGISTTRKHLYFYMLLFLLTAVAHNVWRALQEAAAAQAEDSNVAEIKQITTTARETYR